MFKRPHYCILSAEHNAPCAKRRNNPNNPPKRDNSSILTKHDRNFLPGGDMSTFKRPNYCILCAEHSARCIKRRNKPHN
jgi:hypothetical protein